MTVDDVEVNGARRFRWQAHVGRHRARLAGLVGQGFSFLAMLISLGFAPHREIVNLVAASAIGVAVVNFATLALPMTYPSIQDDDQASIALKSAGVAAVAASIGLCSAGAVLELIRHPQPRLFGSAALLIFMAADYAMVSWLVRTNNADGITANRLRYGLTNFVITAVVATTWHWAWALVFSGCVVYALSMAWVLHSRRSAVLPVIRAASSRSFAEVRRYARANVGHASSYLIFGGSSQAPNLIIYQLGPAAPVWAAVASVCGGFATAISVLVTPSVDTAVSAGMRTGAWEGVGRKVGAGVVEALVLAAIALPASIVLAYHLHYFRHVSASLALRVGLSAVIFWLTSMAQQPVFRAISLLGLRRWRFGWDITRFAALALTIIAFSGITAVMILSIVTACWFIAYAAMVTSVIRAHSRQEIQNRTGGGLVSEH